MKEKTDTFMAYHRFYTPLDIFQSGDGLGKHRETCIDEITFDENGYMQITPTLEGVSAVSTKAEEEGICHCQESGKRRRRCRRDSRIHSRSNRQRPDLPVAVLQC